MKERLYALRNTNIFSKDTKFELIIFLKSSPTNLVDEFVELVMDYDLLSYHSKNYNKEFSLDDENATCDIVESRDRLIKTILRNTSVSMCTKFVDYLCKDAKSNKTLAFQLFTSLIGFFKYVNMEDQLG